MSEMKPEDLGTNATATWQNYRIPLPAPSSRGPQSYIQPPPLSAPPNLMYNGGPPESYSSISPPQHDIQPRRGSEVFGLPATSRNNSGLTSHRSYPSLKRNFATFEENLYARPATFMHEGPPDNEQSSKPSIQSDHRLLSFSSLPPRHTIIDRFGAPAKFDVSAQIHGMFFLSEMSTQSGDHVIMQPELTCYRRNLFQISGSVACPAGSLSVINEQGKSVQVVSQELAISAIESVDRHVIRLIVIPWKTPPANAPEIPTGAEQEPLPIPLTFEGENEDKNSNIVSQQISWRRLQFRIATSNNGRRKELQQHFILRLKVMATLEGGTKACLSESNTAPIVVRGRSPRNFQARKEIPLVGSSASPRGQATQVSPTTVKRLTHGGDNVLVGTTAVMELPKRSYHFADSKFSSPQVPMSNGYQQWNPASHQHSEQSTTASTPTFSQSNTSMPPYMSSMQAIQPQQPPAPSHPITTQPATFDSSRHYYSPPATIQPQYESNYRPVKSPRLSNAANSSIYQSFETAYATELPTQSTSRGVYYSQAPQGGSWTAPDNVVANYAHALQPQSIQAAQPQHSPHSLPNIQHQQRRSRESQQPQEHQPQQELTPSQHQTQPMPNYSYSQDSYQSSIKEEGQNLGGYNWSPAGQ